MILLKTPFMAAPATAVPLNVLSESGSFLLSILLSFPYNFVRKVSVNWTNSWLDTSSIIREPN